MQPGIRYHFFLLTGHSFIQGAVQDGAHDAAGQLSGESRREGASQDTRRVSGRLEGVRQPVLHHQPHGRISAHLSHESLVRNRRQTGESVFAESRQAQISDAHKLLRANSGARRAGQSFGTRGVAGIGADEGRSGCVRESGSRGQWRVASGEKEAGRHTRR